MYLILIIIFIIATIIVWFGFDIKINDIKQIKQIGYDEKLNKITNKLPTNIEVCKQILNELNNKDVVIEENTDKKSQTSLYLVMQNKIIIANIKSTFTRIQTIAHECIHSIQNKKMLKFNFIFSNINILYFITICLLAILKIANANNLVNTANILLITLILFQFIFYIVRSFLETDAMTRAETLAINYTKNKKILTQKEEKTIEENYKEINKIGIKLYNFILFAECAIKIIIYCGILAII